MNISGKDIAPLMRLTGQILEPNTLNRRGRIRIDAKNAYYLRHVCPSVHLSDYIGTAPNGQSYLKFDIRNFCGSPHPNVVKIEYFTRRPN